MSSRIDPKNEKEMRKREEGELITLKARLAGSIEPKIIEKEVEVIKEVDNPELIEEIEKLDELLKVKDNTIKDLQADLKDSEDKLEKIAITLKGKDETIKVQQGQINDLKNAIKTLKINQ